MNTLTANPEFTETQMATLLALPFKTAFLKRLIDDGYSHSDDFHRFLFATEYARSIAFNEIMVEFHGDPSGVEFRSASRQAWAFVIPDASESGRKRIQYFDEHGFSSHYPYDTVFQATSAMVTEGYTVSDRGALDRLSGSKAWARGVEVTSLLQALNYGKITFQEFAARQAALV